VKCKLCGNEVVLVPSAAERVKKDVYRQHPASYYTALFPYHTACQLAVLGRGPTPGHVSSEWLEERRREVGM